MKVIIFCVNYNSYYELNVYLDSIELATNVLEKTDDITVCIADNSIKVKELDTSKYNQITVKQYITNQNLGYFGGIMHLRDELINELDDFNYFVISNVDLKLKNDFFLKLKKEVIAEDIGSVYTSSAGPVGMFTVLGWCVFPFLLPDAVKLALAWLLSRRLAPALRISRR